MSKDFFNARASTWDAKVAEKDTNKLEAMATRLEIKTDASVLDVGTGTGVFTPYLLKKIGPGGKLVCLDFAGEMLKILKSKGFEGNISYICADIKNSQLADKSFDAVVCYSVFPHFENKPETLREIYRLLKEDGRLFICHTSSRQAINDIHRKFRQVCHHLIPENEEVSRMLSDAGFVDVSIHDGKDDYLVSARRPSA